MGEYWESVVETYIENWPSGLYNLSIPQVNVPLGMPKAFLLIFGKIMDGKECSDLDQTYLSAIAAKLTKAGSIFRDGFFVRLGSRSPKDSWLGHREGFKCTDGKKALQLLLDSPERVYDDVALAVGHNYKPQIWLREWRDIPAWSELRCFMRNRKLVGISQYDYLHHERHEELASNAASIQWAVERFFNALLLPVIHLDNVVFDVWVMRRQHGNESVWEVRLLEINPFGPWTDPCLFSWKDGGNFDGTIRYMKESAPKIDLEDYLDGI